MKTRMFSKYKISQGGNHVSVSYDKIPVFCALKYPKFTTITFCPSA